MYDSPDFWHLLQNANYSHHCDNLPDSVIDEGKLQHCPSLFDETPATASLLDETPAIAFL